MTKQELLQDLGNKDFVKKVMSPNLKTEKTEDGAKWYSVPFIEVSEKVAIYRTCDVYVIDEGLETEEAFYKDREPEQTIRESNALLKQYAAQIAAVKGNVLEANDNYIVVEAYKTVNDKAVKVTYIADSDEIRTLTE